MVIDFRKLRNLVFKFAVETDAIKDVEDSTLQTDFLLWMYRLGFVKRRTPINIASFIEKHENEFLDWFLFVREYKDGKTIGEIYAESNGLDDVKNEVSKMKSRSTSYFVAVKGVEEDGIEALNLSNGEKIFIRDSRLPLQVRIGEGLFAIFYPYDGVYYPSGREIIRVDENHTAKVEKSMMFINEFEKIVDEFMDYSEKRGLSERTLKRRYETLTYFTDFLRDELITKMDDIKPRHIRKFLRQSEKEILNFSLRTRREYIAALRKFFKYLYEKNYITTNIMKKYLF